MNSKSDRRRTSRQPVNRVAQIQLGSGMLPRDCLINDISAGGVRLHVEGFDVPDDFVLLLSGPGIAKECAYRVCGGSKMKSARVSSVSCAGPAPRYGARRARPAGFGLSKDS